MIAVGIAFVDYKEEVDAAKALVKADGMKVVLIVHHNEVTLNKIVGVGQGKDRPGTAISHLYIVSRQLRLTRVYCVQIRNWSSVY